jgi:hypothetical protein
VKIISFAPIHNKPGINPKTGKPWVDATHAFIPEAKAFMRHHAVPESHLHLVDNSKPAAWMKAFVLDTLAKEVENGPIHGVAFFCHGFKAGIQFGMRVPDVGGLTKIIAKNSVHDVRVSFYCCDAGRDDDKERTDDMEEFGGDNGFADRVRDHLCMEGKVHCVVDAHTTAAHTTKNPHVRRFEGMGSPLGGIGGYYIVPRAKRALFARWSSALKTNFRFSFPYWTTAEIHKHLLTDV